MKTKLELIKNYPIESLKNWGDYFGYPESICKSMTDMVACDWKNSKIAILDDFGFQMINFLIDVKKVPLQNIYFLVSESDESKVELIKKWYSNFIENEISSVYNINNMFDLIIANPPYGKSSGLAQRIVPQVIKAAQQIVYLAPTNTYKIPELEYVQNIARVDGSVLFGDASIYDLCITRMAKEIGPYKDYASLVLNKKELTLYRNIRVYNKSHPTHFKVEKDFMGCKKDWNKMFAFSFAINNGGSTDAKPWSEIVDLTQYTEKHQGPTSDIKFNFGNDFEAYYNNLKGNVSYPKLIDMGSTQEKGNFKNWYYKAGRLVNKIRSIISQCENITPRPQCYIDYFPHVDWSRPWTDKEILKELGLSEDFLEEKE